MQGDEAARVQRLEFRLMNVGGWLGILLGLWIAGSIAWTAFRDGNYGLGIGAVVFAVPVAMLLMRPGAMVTMFAWNVLAFVWNVLILGVGFLVTLVGKIVRR